MVKLALLYLSWGKHPIKEIIQIFCSAVCSSVTSLVAQMVKRLPTMRETWGSIPGSGRSPREGNGKPLQYSYLENPMDGEVW